MTISLKGIEIDPESGKETESEWEVVQFTDEAIKSLKQYLGGLFATTESGAVWVSFDKGLTWRPQSELIEEAAQEYHDKLKDITEKHYRDREMLAKWYHDKLESLHYDD